MTRTVIDDDDRRLLGKLGRGPDARSTDIASGLGVPGWLTAHLRFCSRCGTELVEGPVAGEDRDRLSCPNCAFISYVNPRLVVTTIPVTDSGELVLIRRGIEPAYGTWSQPGGFLEVDETVAEAAIRETLEETGLIVEPGEIIGLYSRLEAAVVVLVYEARILGGRIRTSAEALEVEAFAPERIPWSEVSLSTTRWALRDWVRTRRPDVDTDSV